MIALPAWAGNLFRSAGNAFAASGLGGLIATVGALLIALLLDGGSTDGRSIILMVLLPLGGVVVGITAGWIPILVGGSLLAHYRASRLAHVLTSGALGILGGIALNSVRGLAPTDPLTFMWTVPAALTAILAFRHLENEARNA